MITFHTHKIFLAASVINDNIVINGLFPTGLLGSNGILPAADTLASNAESSIAEKFANNPSLVWFHSIFRLSVDHFLEYLALFGVLLAAIGNDFNFIFLLYVGYIRVSLKNNKKLLFARSDLKKIAENHHFSALGSGSLNLKKKLNVFQPQT